MNIVKTGIPMTWSRCARAILALTERYRFCSTEILTRSAWGRSLRTLCIGTGPRTVLYSAAHHGNEWITAPVLLKFMEDYAGALDSGGEIFGVRAEELSKKTRICTVPMVDPDGVDLVTGAIAPGSEAYAVARRMAARYPKILFPEGWKANLLGVDLNLQYPAGWEQARENKFRAGFTSPGPRDYVGRAPLCQREPRALAEYTKELDPALVLAYHSQGKEIYWQFGDPVPGAEELGRRLAQVSGYRLADTPYQSGFAGYKDWFIQEFRRPGYTVEVGKGKNPLPLSQFEEIYRDNLGILVTAALG